MVEPSIERGLGGGFRGVTAGDGEARGKKAPHSLHHGGLPGRRKPPGDDGSLTDGLAEPTAAFGSRLPLLSWTPGAGQVRAFLVPVHREQPSDRTMQHSMCLMLIYKQRKIS